MEQYLRTAIGCHSGYTTTNKLGLSFDNRFEIDLGDIFCGRIDVDIYKLL